MTAKKQASIEADDVSAGCCFSVSPRRRPCYLPPPVMPALTLCLSISAVIAVAIAVSESLSCKAFTCISPSSCNDVLFLVSTPRAYISVREHDDEEASPEHHRTRAFAVSHSISKTIFTLAVRDAQERPCAIWYSDSGRRRASLILRRIDYNRGHVPIAYAHPCLLSYHCELSQGGLLSETIILRNARDKDQNMLITEGPKQVRRTMTH